MKGSRRHDVTAESHLVAFPGPKRTVSHGAHLFSGLARRRRPAAPAINSGFHVTRKRVRRYHSDIKGSLATRSRSAARSRRLRRSQPSDRLEAGGYIDPLAASSREIRESGASRTATKPQRTSALARTALSQPSVLYVQRLSNSGLCCVRTSRESCAWLVIIIDMYREVVPRVIRFFYGRMGSCMFMTHVFLLSTSGYECDKVT